MSQTDKWFRWQYSGEKILFWFHENLISFFIHISFLAFSLFLFLIIIASLLGYFLYPFLWVLIFWIGISWTLYYFFHEYHSNYLIFTSRRIIKNVSSSLFAQHKKELHIKDFKQVTSTQNSFIERIFWYGNIIVNFGDGSAIHFRWINKASEVSEYIARVMDYMDKNPHTDNIASFKPRKIRHHN